MLRSMHTMDIPFVMENVDLAKTELGEGKERYALQDRMSTAFVTFARTGNPNHKGIPNWSPYTPAQRAKMELGEGKERYALQDRMSTAFVTFARTGNPNHKGIPNWSPYTPAQRA